jgi:hypothetical protein
MKHERLFLLFLVLLALAVSLCIPLFTVVKQAAPVVYHPRLFPLYYQINIDATTELATSLGFPGFFKKEPYRVNRPLMAGAVALLRTCVAGPLARLVLPRRITAVRWGGYTAIDVVLTCFLWILLNTILTYYAGIMCFKMLTKYLGAAAALGAAAMLVTTPIVVLGLREIQYGALELFLIAASLYYWQTVAAGRTSRSTLVFYSLACGVLFLGKLALTTFFVAGLLCLFSSQRKLVPLLAAVTVVPTVLWIAACGMLGIPYVFSDAVNYAQPLGRFASGLHAGWGIFSFAGMWASALWENAGWAHLPFFAAGLVSLATSGRSRLLLVALAFALADFLFYFALFRTHAAYALHTMIFYFPVVAQGIWATVVFVRSRWMKGASDSTAGWLAVAIVLCLQVIVCAAMLPRYAG